MSEKVLVTGGAGYIGSVLTSDLLLAGYEVVLVDNFMYGENSLASNFINPKLRVEVGDCRSIELIKSLSRDCDWVVPLAAIVGAPACKADPTGSFSTNVTAAVDLFHSVPHDSRIIMPTTNSAYGTTPAGTVTTEDSPLNPISEYAAHKVKVEEELMSRGNSTSFRLATVFGMSPRMRIDLLVNNLVFRAINDKSVVLYEPHFIRNFIHVRDVSAAIMLAMKNWNEFEGEVFNVGLSSANLSKKQLCELIAKEVPGFTYFEDFNSKDPDQRNYLVSNAKIEARGFEPKVDLLNGIRELIKGLPTLKMQKYVNVR